MDKKPSSRPNPFDAQGAQRLVLTLAVTSTIGFWAIFARGAREASAWSEDANPASGDVAALQSSNQVVINLPPMPTLIPPLNAADLAAGAAPVTANFQSPAGQPQQPLTFSNPASAPKPQKLFIGGGGKRQTGGKRAPTTTTRSSK